MTEVLLLLVLLLLSAFFSGSETAITALSTARAEELAQDGRHGSASLLRLKRSPRETLIAVLIGNNLVNIGASAAATVLATRLFGAWGPGLAVGVLTLVILIFGEITPKSFAIRHAAAMGLVAAPPLEVFARLVFPLVWILERFTGFLQSLSAAHPDPSITERELIQLASHGAREGTIEHDEKEIIERVFQLDRLRAADVMTPRHHVVSMDGRRTVSDALPDLLAARHSRYPLHTGETDVITGMVHIRDVLEVISQDEQHRTLSDLSHPAIFVPMNSRVDELLDQLRSRERNLIVVVNEFGIIQGVLTLEDLLEELVGEIYYDLEQSSPAIREDGGALLADGAVELRELGTRLGVNLKGKPTDSVNLWILNHSRRIPKPGEKFTIDGLRIRVEKASRHRIHRVRVGLTESGSS